VLTLQCEGPNRIVLLDGNSLSCSGVPYYRPSVSWPRGSRFHRQILDLRSGRRIEVRPRVFVADSQAITPWVTTATVGLNPCTSARIQILAPRASRCAVNASYRTSLFVWNVQTGKLLFRKKRWRPAGRPSLSGVRQGSTPKSVGSDTPRLFVPSKTRGVASRLVRRYAVETPATPIGAREPRTDRSRSSAYQGAAPRRSNG